MKDILYLLSLGFLASACGKDQNISSTNPVNWEKRTLALSPTDSLVKGITYLSVYSEIYSTSEHKTISLTSTLMRTVLTFKQKIG